MTRLENDSDRLLMGTSRHHPFLKNRGRLTPSQDAMLREHLAYLVLSEHRSACWRDFLNFDINGVPYALQLRGLSGLGTQSLDGRAAVVSLPPAKEVDKIKLPTCKYCNSEIAWQEEETEGGFELCWIPTDPMTGTRHRCRERKSIFCVPPTILCRRRCNNRPTITFDDNQRGRNGRKIPLEADSRQPHRCP
jgi:hypothetical protein